MKIKKKLRDVSFEEFIKWKVNNCLGKTCANCMFGYVRCDFREKYNWVSNKELYSDKFLDQEIEVSEEILTDEEKEYLSAVIKPFREKVISIIKYYSSLTGNYQYICISIKQGQLGKATIILPYFKCNTMYKGMKEVKEYTLEELGL